MRRFASRSVGYPSRLGIVLFLFAAMLFPAGGWGAGGELLWDDQFDKGAGDNEAFAIAVQGGRVYAAGRGETAGGDDEWVVRAYDARTGELLWDDLFDKGGPTNVPIAIAAQGGIVYAAGSGTTNTLAFVWVVRAYDAQTGELL